MSSPVNDKIKNPYLVGVDGAHALLSARVCSQLEQFLGRELAALRTRLRGVDQEAAFGLMALREAALRWVPPEEQQAANSEERTSQLREWLSTTEAADHLRVSRRAVGQAITRQRLPAVKVGREWRVRRADVEEYGAARAA